VNFDHSAHRSKLEASLNWKSYSIWYGSHLCSHFESS